MDVSLQRLAEQQEKDGELISKLKGAMVYPVIVTLVMVLVVVGMLIFVLPQVETFYDGLPDDEPLPAITRLLLWTSDVLKNFWFLVIGVSLGLVVLIRYFLKTNFGRTSMDRFKLDGPGIKNLYQKIYMARFTRTVGTLFGSGVNLIQALEIIQGGINNMHMERSIGRTIALIQEGTPFSTALARDKNFLDLVSDMVKIGEQSGKTEEMLMKRLFITRKKSTSRSRP